MSTMFEPHDNGATVSRLPSFAGWPIAAVAAGVALLLVAVAGRYGYHRDELYFLVAGRHLAWGYPDQPPLVPLLARLLNDLAPGSLVVLRLPSALAAAAITALTALIARELGGQRSAQLLAAASMAVATLLLAVGHLLSTTTFDLLAWALVLWLVARILRTGAERLWLVVGVVAGVGLLDNDLVAFLAVAVLLGVAIAGPRRLLASRWLWIGALVAALLWAPYLVWQAQHGWPELALGRAIAAGSSGTSQPRWVFLPYQILLVGPLLAPIWIAGLVRLFRDRGLRWCRALGWAWVLLAAVFIATGGKPYYLGGMFPLLVGAGAAPTVAWVRRGRARLRRGALAAVLALSAATSVFLMLPFVPVGTLHRTPIVAINYDAGETVAWPTYVGEIAAVFRRLPADQRTNAVVLASNYGEAGAVDRFGSNWGLPQAFSGHNGFWYWGPPPASAQTVVAVGFDRGYLERFFGDCRLAAQLDNHLDVNDDEQHAPVWVCSGLRGTWLTLWPQFRQLG
jgi:4-amino-4-deoxy-L-arabinose transferase-like glycosyltransferase